MSLNYRADIDGLRGLSIILVLLFHLFPNTFTGGYVGVDVFFVLSGYLITSLLLQEYENKEFSFLEFYRRRMRRILPALFLVTFVTLIVCALFLLPKDYWDMASSVKKIIVFASNWHFLHSLGYFKPTTWEMPLANTWSLAVEEQFYFLWPAVIYFTLVKWNSRKLLIGLTAFAFLVSLVRAEYLLSHKYLAQSAYYLLLPRGNELLVGALVALLGLKLKPNKYLTYLGLALIVTAAVYFNSTTPFPGLWALVPCAGAAFVILGNSNTFLNSRLMVFVGMISYSLYLWHWPMLAGIRYVFPLFKIKILTAFGLFIFIAVLSVLTWKYVEQPIRRTSWSFRKTFLSLLVVPGFIIWIFAHIVASDFGWQSRYDHKDQEALFKASVPSSNGYCFNQMLPNCYIGDKKSEAKKDEILLFGDSLAGHYIPFWNVVGLQSQHSIYAAAGGFCKIEMFLDNTLTGPEYCNEMIPEIQKRIKKSKVIILGQHLLTDDTETLIENLEALFLRLSQAGKIVLFMEAAPAYEEAYFQQFFRSYYAPVWKKDSQFYRQQLIEQADSRIERLNQRLQDLIQKYPSVHFVKTISLLGEAKNQLPFFDGILGYSDFAHLNEFGSKTLAEKIKDHPDFQKNIQFFRE